MTKSHTELLPEHPPDGASARTHVDDRLLKLDVQTVVGRGDDGVLRSPHVLRELSM